MVIKKLIARKTEAEEAVRKNKPCFMMNKLIIFTSIEQYNDTKYFLPQAY
jgi:hypothetical protein